jgi:hypothetical protein
MDKDEALKMAIKALDSCDCAEGMSGKYQFYDAELIDPAINACKEALATNKDSLLVQPAQNPVAWIDEANNTISTVQLMKYGWLGSDNRAIPNAWIKLYTHLYQWQGLAEDDFHEAQNVEFKRGAAWAEQILEERNHGT